MCSREARRASCPMDLKGSGQMDTCIPHSRMGHVEQSTTVTPPFYTVCIKTLHAHKHRGLSQGADLVLSTCFPVLGCCWARLPVSIRVPSPVIGWNLGVVCFHHPKIPPALLVQPEQGADHNTWAQCCRTLPNTNCGFCHYKLT